MTLHKQNPVYQKDLDFILSIKGIEKLRNKKFLITGSTGLIGVCLIDALMKYNEHGANIHMYAVGRNREKAFSRLGEYFENELFEFVEQDVRFPLNIVPAVDYIIPLASNTHPIAYSQYPVETIEINVKGAENALKKAVESGATVLYPSTVEVYGNAIGNDVFTEEYTGKLNLSTARASYTESKRVSEALCQSYISEKNSKVKIVRLSRIFGPTMLSSDTKASSQFIKKAVNGEDIVLKSEGNQYFSYTYVADAVAAMLYVLLHGENGLAYNISNNDCDMHLKDFAQYCAKFIGRKVIFDLPSESEKKGFSIAVNAILDNRRLRQLGFIPSYSSKIAIERTISILRSKF